MKYMTNLLVLLLAGTAFGFQNRDDRSLKSFQLHKAFLLDNGGQWQTSNHIYNSQDEWSDSLWGYQFEKGINANTFKLKITGFVSKQNKTQTYWDGIYTWDPAANKGIYLSTNPWGGIAQGETERIDDQSIVMVFTITNPDGSSVKHRDIHTINGETMKSQSFDWKNDKWTLKDESVWVRVK